MGEVVPPSKLAAVEGMNATCGNFLSYSTRHMARVDALLQKTFLFDLAIQSAGGLALPDSTNGEQHASSDADGGAERALKRTMDVLLGDAEDEEDEVNVPTQQCRGPADENGE